MTGTITPNPASIVVPDYESVEAWALDSDYFRDDTSPTGWSNENGWADIVQACIDAHEASGEQLGERIRLWSSHESINPNGNRDDQAAHDAVMCMLFGELVRHTVGIVEHYHSDLYRDAQRLRRITGPTRFWYVAREWGTNMMWPTEPGSDECLNEALNRSGPSAGWWVELDAERGTWFATFTPIAKA